MTFADAKAPSPAVPDIRPASPCIRACVLDAAGTCAGCGRTRDEIACWSGMSAREQWAIVRRIGRDGT